MAKRVQRRRGTTSEHGSFTGAVGEISVDTTKDTVAVHDGSQAGGFPLAREDMNNVTNRIGITQLNCSDGSANQFLKTNGSGTLSFATVDATTAAVGGDLSGTVGNAQIVANAITATELGTNAVITAKITDGAVTAVKLAASAVTTVKINDGAVTTGKIADSQITSSKILDGTIVAGDIASNAITSIKILDGNVTGAKIPSNAIDSHHYVDGSIDQTHYGDGTIIASKFVPQTRGKILYATTSGAIGWLSPGAAGTVLKSDGADPSYGSIATADIADDAVTYAKMADAAVTTAVLADGNVATGKIADNAVTSAKIADAALASFNAYDIAFTAGFDKDMVKEDIAVATYGELVMARAGTFIGEAGYIDTAPTGTMLILDIFKNGATIYPSTKPHFATTANGLTAGALGTTTFVSGDRITFKVTQIGSSEPGEGVRFTLKCKLTE